MQLVRIGIVGCASIAERLVIPALLQLKHKFQLVAIASRESTKAAQFAAAFQTTPITGYENLLDRSDIDAVYIPLPTRISQEWTAKALSAGKHVIAEKSISSDYPTTQTLVAAAQAGKRVLFEDFMFQYHAQHKKTQELLRNEAIGAIRLFRSQFGFPPLAPSNFRYIKELGGGCLLDAAAYTVSAALMFFGFDQQVVSSVLHCDAKTGVDLYGNASLLTSDGIASQLSFGFDNYYRCNYEFWGTKGIIRSPKSFTPKPSEGTTIELEQNNILTRFEIPPDNHFVNIFEEFYKCISNGVSEQSYDRLLAQSRVLSDIREKAIRISV